MQASLILPYFVLWATLVNALFVKASFVPPACSGCGRRPSEGDVCFCEFKRQRG